MYLDFPQHSAELALAIQRDDNPIRCTIHSTEIYHSLFSNLNIVKRSSPKSRSRPTCVPSGTCSTLMKMVLFMSGRTIPKG